jgi:hypothetical protein
MYCLAQRDQADVLQVEHLLHMADRFQVAVMNRVKGSAEYTDHA